MEEAAFLKDFLENGKYRVTVAKDVARRKPRS